MAAEEEEEEEDEDEDGFLTNSPEPLEPLEPEEMAQTEGSGQAGQLHKEQNLAHIFRVGVSQPQDLEKSDLQMSTSSASSHLPCVGVLQSIQDVLSKLSDHELLKFKRCFSWQGSEVNQQQLMVGDLLDYVDKMLEVLGRKTTAAAAAAMMLQLM